MEKTIEQELYEMKIHETKVIETTNSPMMKYIVTRVATGWLYQDWNQPITTFVPLTTYSNPNI